MPGSIAAWTTLVEDRIQRAQLRGVFQNVKGRGKPFQVDTEESNPYIDRTEYLMNRIVQRQGAAPPWIDLQQRTLLPTLWPYIALIRCVEVDGQLHAFRSTLRDAWTRRAIRMLCLAGPQRLTASFIDGVPRYRDAEWEKRERYGFIYGTIC